MSWADTYASILESFAWTAHDDVAAAASIPKPDVPGTWRHIGTDLRNRAVVHVVGCAKALDALGSEHLQPDGPIVAADGAVTHLRRLGIVPRVVVTDLDGAWEDLDWAAQQGASMVVHAHGGNVSRLAQTANWPQVVYTVQPPVDHAAWFEAPSHRCAESFTDGDRAVTLACQMGARQVRLHAFDFVGPSSPCTGDSDPVLKAQKLRFAKQIVVDLLQEGHEIAYAPSPLL